MSQTTVTPTVNHSGASYVIKFGGVTDVDSVVSLSVGSNVITVEVTAQDGETTRTYTVTVTRAEPSSTDATLSALTLSGIDFGTFDSTTTSYTGQVANNVAETTVTPTVNQSGTSYVVKLGGVEDEDGEISLAVGSNVIAIEVTAEDGITTQTYTVTVTREESTLRGPSLCVSGGAVSDQTNTGLVSDCDTLLAARDTLAGTAKLNWSADTPIGQWEGVTLRGTPERVAWLALSAKGLNGAIPTDLGELSMLTNLNLRSNQLSGSIPGSLGQLSRLTSLNLHTNKLSGSIPDLSGLTRLEGLYLPNNMLTGPVPKWLNGMTSMRELWLWGNELSGTIPDLSGMTRLEKLKLAGNNLTGGIPASLGSMSNLKWLIIQENRLGGSIPDLSGMTSLTHLWIHTNGLTGSIPATLGRLSNLDDLNLRTNMLTGGIPDLSGLDNLTRLRLHRNMLSGDIPASLGGLDSLQRLWLHGNKLTGGIPDALGSLADTLVEIGLKENNLDADACVPTALANVATNDYADAGLEVCGSDDGS